MAMYCLSGILRNVVTAVGDLSVLMGSNVGRGGVLMIVKIISEETFFDIMPRLLFLVSLRWEFQRIV